ncbi:NRAMP family divalent metal transporter [Erythrobacter sp. JK5]|uniref:NRAMP family divalent metal transporter n=1 Tax=Erythrobacter sp. JK5 TaxID=2829500 RepID=UPI001BA74200|nr:divalent metal cation transporter [Erythrobacter sp. JK5]QUL37643.1 divalent metal cation transporter [Erythrobacter sp. JK5]
MTAAAPAQSARSHTNWSRIFGPALLFSGSAIGTSHLVQSTRAGAVYGLALVAVILLANLLKYPAFRFGVDYGHATRRSILAGYRHLGRWAVALFGLAIIPITPIIHAAVTAATAGVFIAVTGVEVPVTIVGAVLLLAVGALLLTGGYDWLDKVNRVLLAFLVISTLATTIMVLPQVQWGTLADVAWIGDPVAILFVIALAGFMPNPLEVSVSQSLWTAKVEQDMGDGGGSRLAEARTAFAAGYTMTALLAVCFCIMGAGVMHSGGIAPASNAPAFAAQVIGLYRSVLGDGAALLASIAALSVMLTTALAAVDIGSRIATSTVQHLTDRTEPADFARLYRFAVPLVVALDITVLFTLLDDFTTLMDLATSLAFVAAPVIAVLNHIAVTGRTMPADARPERWTRWLNLAAIIVMTGLSIAFFVLR